MADLHLESDHRDRNESRTAIVATPPIPTPRRAQPGPQHAEPDWFDLAGHQPGQGVRALVAAEPATMRRAGRLTSLVTRLLRTPTQERRYRVAAEGQEQVGARLGLLRGWHVLHSLPMGGSGAQLDHLVIGPGGVFALATHNHPRSTVWVGLHDVRVDGQHTLYLPAARADADQVHRLLSAATGFPVPVQPAVVLLTGSRIPDVTISQAPEDVVVYDRMDLPGALRRTPRRLTDDQVAVIFDQARRSTTWSDPLLGSGA